MEKSKETRASEDSAFITREKQRIPQECSADLFADAIGAEDVTKRERSVKHFDLGVNRYQAVVYPAAVHYKENGSDEWTDIDNTLEPSVNTDGRPVIKNRANSLRVEFPAMSDNGAIVSKGIDFPPLA